MGLFTYLASFIYEQIVKKTEAMNIVVEKISIEALGQNVSFDC